MCLMLVYKRLCQCHDGFCCLAAGHVHSLDDQRAHMRTDHPVSFRQDIFTINQKQLESAVRRITGDPGLEPQRKDYLVQHIMASRYVVAQQMRLEDAVVTPSSDPARTFAAKCVTGPDMLCASHMSGILPCLITSYRAPVMTFQHCDGISVWLPCLHRPNHVAL